MSSAVMCDDTSQALWAKFHMFVWNFPVLVTFSSCKTDTEIKQFAMVEARNVYIQTHCGQVVLQLRNIILKENLFTKRVNTVTQKCGM